MGDNSVTIVEPDGRVGRPVRHDLFDCPNGITVGPDGRAYVVNFNNAHVLAISPGGDVSRLTSLPEGRNAHIAWAAGSFWVTRIADSSLWRVERDGSAARVVGTGEAGLEDGPADRAGLAFPNGIAASPDGRWLWINNLDGVWRGDEPTRIVLRRVGPLTAREPGTSPPSPTAGPRTRPTPRAEPTAAPPPRRGRPAPAWPGAW